MCVDEARSHRATVKIDHLGPAVCERAHVAARADRDDLAAGDGNALRDRIGRVDGDDGSVDEDQIGGRLSSRECRRDDGDQRDPEGRDSDGRVTTP